MLRKNYNLQMLTFELSRFGLNPAEWQFQSRMTGDNITLQNKKDQSLQFRARVQRRNAMTWSLQELELVSV